MARLKKIIEESYNKKMLEADEEAPLEDTTTDEPALEEPVEGAEEANEEKSEA